MPMFFDPANVPASTWAARPTSGVATGQVMRMSDVGVSPGILVVWNGTRWVPAGMQLLARLAAAAAAPADTNENILLTATIPAGLLGADGGLIVNSTWTFTNSANTKTTRIRLGGVGGTQFLNCPFTTLALLADLRIIRNRTASTQIGSINAAQTGGGLGSNTGVPTTGAVDTSVSTTLVLTGQKASAGETIQLEIGDVWVTP